MSKRRKVSMTGIVLVICMLICLLIALAVVPGGFGSDNKKDLDDENTPGLHEVIEDGSPLMIFDKRAETRALIKEFDEDTVQSVSAALGNEGSSVVIDVTEEEEITAIYKALKNVVVGEELGPDESDATAASSSPNAEGGCNISFVLSDDSTCDFVFESTEVYYLDGSRYAVSGTEGLWSVIKELGNQ